MKGLELSERYYRAYGQPMLESRFPALLPHLACGLIGEGSECLGYDDEISQDHDFEPGFILFLPGENVVSRRDAFLLERAYQALPDTFEGFRRKGISPVGGNRLGVRRLDAFLEEKTGRPDGVLTLKDWMTVPEQGLLEVTAGRVFYDGPGTLTGVRAGLRRLPDDVRVKRLAGHLLLMGQAGQYNYGRCLRRGEHAAAASCLYRFAESAVHAAHLLEGRYVPYYKWQFRSLREIPVVAEGYSGEALSADLEALMTGPGDAGKQEAVERVATRFAEALREFGLTDGNIDPELERAAYAVNGRVEDPGIRNLNILAAVI